MCSSSPLKGFACHTASKSKAREQIVDNMLAYNLVDAAAAAPLVSSIAAKLMHDPVVTSEPPNARFGNCNLPDQQLKAAPLACAHTQ